MAVAAVRQLLGDLSPVRFQVPEPENGVQVLGGLGAASGEDEPTFKQGFKTI